MKFLKGFSGGFLKGFIGGIPFACLVIILINSHKNRMLIREVAKSQVLIIELMREKKTIVIDSLTIRLSEGACSE